MTAAEGLMETRALHDLMGGYFHQDWDIYGDEDAVVDEFLADQVSLRGRLLLEIEQLLGSAPTEHDLEEFLADLGCQYDPRPRYGSQRAWLESIAAQARAAR